MKYYVLFSYQGKPVFGTWAEGKDTDDAMLNAEFKAIAFIPNVAYDECHEKEGK